LIAHSVVKCCKTPSIWRQNPKGLSKTYSLPESMSERLFFLERVMGFEPTTVCLGSRYATTASHPRDVVYWPLGGMAIKVRSRRSETISVWQRSTGTFWRAWRDRLRNTLRRSWELQLKRHSLSPPVDTHCIFVQLVEGRLVKEEFVLVT
jgi:hypothetical protein